MEGVIVHCPICHGRALAADTPVRGMAHQRLAGQTYYCPSCEMFVEPADELPNADLTLESIDPGETPEDRGRPRASGTNAGGSQRGDLSDQGASQWRRDLAETERNTWKDKD